ncbi:hypothetical protein G6F65_013006 [Rhizopus arrhizus]|nr:hypothetical protein G6F65_013006 [Rhizopus arrhizus]
MPTTAAFTPAAILRTPGRRRRLSQNGKAPATSNAPGRKMTPRNASPPSHPDKGPDDIAPRKAANANTGPGMACAAP